jgi:hypothetical protein
MDERYIIFTLAAVVVILILVCFSQGLVLAQIRERLKNLQGNKYQDKV